jgi:hypothetical protein
MYGSYGEPGDFKTQSHKGVFAPFEEGITVTQTCKSVTPRSGFTELVSSLSVGRKGAWLTETQVDYSVGSKQYSLVAPWNMVACGRLTATDGICKRTG